MWRVCSQGNRIMIPGSVTDLHFMDLDPQAKFVAINEQPDHNVKLLQFSGQLNT
jgi:hypothetical protein